MSPLEGDTATLLMRLWQLQPRFMKYLGSCVIMASGETRDNKKNKIPCLGGRILSLNYMNTKAERQTPFT